MILSPSASAVLHQDRPLSSSLSASEMDRNIPQRFHSRLQNDLSLQTELSHQPFQQQIQAVSSAIAVKVI